jgi:regulator of protease activity HflC (stomatin/prohibitin superfamily)
MDSKGPDAQNMHDGKEKPFNVMIDCISPILSICCCPCVLWCSWKQVNERQEAVVLQWGRYTKTVKEPGIRWINCLGSTVTVVSTAITSVDLPNTKTVDFNGNPLVVSAVLTYCIKDSYKATIAVVNYHEFVVQQAQAILKQVISRYPYESVDKKGASLKNEGKEIGRELVECLQEKVDQAGVQIQTFQFNEMSYAPEIASQMLKRQQASALIQARAAIVEGAVETAFGAIQAMEAKGIKFTPEGKEKLVTSLLTVMCSEHDATPTVNVSGN